MPVMGGSPVCSYYETITVPHVTGVFGGSDTPVLVLWCGGYWKSPQLKRKTRGFSTVLCADAVCNM
nr:MAG TPA: hypothetical protein [Caudoviricetes sp.]